MPAVPNELGAVTLLLAAGYYVANNSNSTIARTGWPSTSDDTVDGPSARAMRPRNRSISRVSPHATSPRRKRSAFRTAMQRNGRSLLHEFQFIPLTTHPSWSPEYDEIILKFI
ncbi:hypothetical protein [Burkholderia metallica]|uniref:hypothetical protein n=1 Tax=Burkholderia metallica TaxID=488729 RepID=UPI00131A80C2|nr:hypothetical protein [Burkholderia metallica]